MSCSIRRPTSLKLRPKSMSHFSDYNHPTQLSIYLFIYLLQFFVLHFNLNTRLQWLREILKGAQVQSTCNTIAASLEMLPHHRLYRLTAMTSTAFLLTRVCCWAVDIPASLGCSSACTNSQQHPQNPLFQSKPQSKCP